MQPPTKRVRYSEDFRLQAHLEDRLRERRRQRDLVETEMTALREEVEFLEDMCNFIQRFTQATADADSPHPHSPAVSEKFLTKVVKYPCRVVKYALLKGLARLQRTQTVNRSKWECLRRDGTYKLHFGGWPLVSLGIFGIRYTARHKNRQKFYPMAFMFVRTETTFGYARMVSVYKERRHEFFGGTMSMHFGSMDHSDAIANTFREVLPDIKLLNCWSRLERKSREKKALLSGRERYSDIIRPKIGYLSQARSLDQFMVLSELVTQTWADLEEDEYVV